MGGFYLMHRGWHSHPVFGSPKKSPFCPRSAWSWLIDHAAYEPAKVRVGSKIICLDRGQMTHSLRFLADAWGWSVGRVQRFVSLLNRERMIDTASEAGQMVITICNYDFFQAVPSSLREPADSPPIQQRFKVKEESPSGSNEPSGGSLRSQRARETDAAEADFAEWWEAYPHKVGKAAAQRAYRAALARASPGQLLAGVGRYVASKPPERQWCNPATFLNQDRWLDQPALILPINGGKHVQPAGKQSPATKLFAGFAAAAGFDSGIGGAPLEPLLDRRRSA